MGKQEIIQLNVRSRFARDRAAGLARETGMTITQVVEEALRAYQPPTQMRADDGLVRKGRLMVWPGDGRPLTVEDADAVIAAVRLDRS